MIPVTPLPPPAPCSSRTLSRDRGLSILLCTHAGLSSEVQLKEPEVRIALVLLERAGDEGQFQPDELRNALAAIASMIRRAKAAQAGFPPGTSQHTLQKNRLKALRIAKTRIKTELDKGDA